jgi:hypothetical protein
MMKIFCTLGVFIPMFCFCMQAESPEIVRESHQQTEMRNLPPPPDGTRREESRAVALFPIADDQGQLDGGVRFTNAQEFPMQMLADSSCIERFLRWSTTCCFFSRGVLNVMSGVFYAVGGGLLLLPGMLTNDAASLKLFNVFSCISLTGAVTCREMAACSQRQIIDNEEEFARIQMWRDQHSQGAPVPQDPGSQYAEA